MPDITAGQLAEVLRDRAIQIVPDSSGTDARGHWVTGKPRYPVALAENILEEASGVACPATVPAHTPPPYYAGKDGMQPFDVIDAFGLNFYEGNVIKYICRWRNKNGVADLRKARTYIDQAIARAESEASHA